VLALAAAASAQSADYSAEFELLKRATVFISQTKTEAGHTSLRCISTGTLISADGLIISNAHGVLPSPACDGDSLIVSLAVDLDEPPIPKYRAEIASADSGLDIALLRIHRELDGRSIAAGELPALPFANIGESEAVAIDDTLMVLGYPDVGNSPADVRRGTVTAILAEPVAGSRAWFKTRAEIPGAMAGGGAYNTRGQLIGIPTNAAQPGLIATNCRYLSDSNGDSLVNSSDHCVLVGDFISSIRPIAAARKLIRRARLSLSVTEHNRPALPAAASAPARITRAFFAPALQANMPATVVGALPANTRNLYFFFDYDNMRPETLLELRVQHDGIPAPTFSLPPVRWSGGARGTWYIGAREQAWANGAYEFTLLVDGASAASRQILVGGGNESRGRFSDIVFGTEDAAGNLLGNGNVLPVASAATARFLYDNLPAEATWTAIWSYDGAEFARSSAGWSDGAQGSKVISVRPEGGLLPGEYRLELFLGGVLAATGDFVVAGSAGAPLPQVFRNLAFTSGDSPARARTAAATSNFPSGISALFARFDWAQIAAGTPWSLRWMVDEQVFFESAERWALPEAGSAYLLSLPNPPDGRYSLQVLVNGLVLAESAATVGIGQLPIDRFTAFSGTSLRGRVIDAGSGRGLPSVTLVLISELVAASEFTWQQDEVVALATSDRNGNFQFARPLAFDSPYSMVIEAEGYIPQAADGFQFKASQPTADILIEMVRG